MSIINDAVVAGWLKDAPLYEMLPEQPSLQDAVRWVYLFEKAFDMYCPGCKAIGVFQPVVPREMDDFYRNNPGRIRLGGDRQLKKVAVCARDGTTAFFYFYQKDEGLIKSGQYPSLADLALPETAKFRRAIGVDRLRELNKAIGLAAHGVGVGSYVYLRRIFESLVEEAHKEAMRATDWDEELYVRSRMAEKVKAVQAHLPDFIIKAPHLYSILSKHLHELSEEECLENFELMKLAIYMIAEDRLQALERAELREKARQEIEKLGQKLAGDDRQGQSIQ